MAQITLGLGKYSIGTGTYDRAPAVYITPVKEPGIVGYKVSPSEDDPPIRNTLLDGETVIKCTSTAHANKVSSALLNERVRPPATLQRTTAELDVILERRRQQEIEGWTPQHDDGHADGDLARAAACYALEGKLCIGGTELAEHVWPLSSTWWKPTTRRRNLVKAGALILAEIERLDRQQATKAEGDT